VDVPRSRGHGIGDEVAEDHPQRRGGEREPVGELGDDLGGDRAQVAERLVETLGGSRPALVGGLGMRGLQDRVDELERELDPGRGIVEQERRVERRLELVCDERREVLERLVLPCQPGRLQGEPLLRPPAPDPSTGA